MAGSAGPGVPLREQIQQYLRFFSTKRDAYLGEIGAVIRDVRDARLSETVFSQEEVQSILDEASEALRESATRELDKHAQMGALVLEQVFMSAAVAGVAVSIDLSKTEDEASLVEVGKMKRLDAALLGAAERAGKAELDKLGDEHRKLQEEFEAVRASCERAESARERLERQVGELTRRGDELQKEVESAKAAAGSASHEAARASQAVPEHARTEIEGLRAQVAGLQTALEDARAGATEEAVVAAPAGADEPAGGGGGVAGGAGPASRVTQTKQFRMLKDMLARKNKQVIELRARLRRYEPEDEDARDADAGETPLRPKGSQGSQGPRDGLV